MASPDPIHDLLLPGRTKKLPLEMAAEPAPHLSYPRSQPEDFRTRAQVMELLRGASKRRRAEYYADLLHRERIRRQSLAEQPVPEPGAASVVRGVPKPPIKGVLLPPGPTPGAMPVRTPIDVMSAPPETVLAGFNKHELAAFMYRMEQYLSGKKPSRARLRKYLARADKVSKKKVLGRALSMIEQHRGKFGRGFTSEWQRMDPDILTATLRRAGVDTARAGNHEQLVRMAEERFGISAPAGGQQLGAVMLTPSMQALVRKERGVKAPGRGQAGLGATAAEERAARKQAQEAQTGEVLPSFPRAADVPAGTPVVDPEARPAQPAAPLAPVAGGQYFGAPPIAGMEKSSYGEPITFSKPIPMFPKRGPAAASATTAAEAMYPAPRNTLQLTDQAIRSLVNGRDPVEAYYIAASLGHPDYQQRVRRPGKKVTSLPKTDPVQLAAREELVLPNKERARKEVQKALSFQARVKKLSPKSKALRLSLYNKVLRDIHAYLLDGPAVGYQQADPARLARRAAATDPASFKDQLLTLLKPYSTTHSQPQGRHEVSVETTGMADWTMQGGTPGERSDALTSGAAMASDRANVGHAWMTQARARKFMALAQRGQLTGPQMQALLDFAHSPGVGDPAQHQAARDTAARILQVNRTAAGASRARLRPAPLAPVNVQPEVPPDTVVPTAPEAATAVRGLDVHESRLKRGVRTVADPGMSRILEDVPIPRMRTAPGRNIPMGMMEAALAARQAGEAAPDVTTADIDNVMPARPGAPTRVTARRVLALPPPPSGAATPPGAAPPPGQPQATTTKYPPANLAKYTGAAAEAAAGSTAVQPANLPKGSLGKWALLGAALLGLGYLLKGRDEPQQQRPDPRSRRLQEEMALRRMRMFKTNPRLYAQLAGQPELLPYEAAFGTPPENTQEVNRAILMAMMGEAGYNR